MKGFTLIEILLAVALAAIFIPAIGTVLSFSLNRSLNGENYSKAYSLSQEGMEAIFYLKNLGGANWNWTTTPINTSGGNFYQPALSGGNWALNTMTLNPSITSGIFTRKIEILAVTRGLDKKICKTLGCGTTDNMTRNIIVDVTWKENGQTNEVKNEAYVTNH